MRRRHTLLVLLAAACQSTFASEELAVALETAGGSAIELRLNRMLALDDGRLAILIADTDVTALFRPAQLNWTLDTAVLPLPTGEQPLRVYRVSLRGEWREIAAYTVRVVKAGATPQPSPPAPAESERPKLSFQPMLSLTYKSQHYSRYAPVETAPPRPTFDDGTLQAGVKAGWNGRTASITTDWNVAGATAAVNTLRFAEKGAAAPHVDLASYLTSVQWNGATLQLGHVQAGTSRHLMDNFASRGIRFVAPLGRRADFTMAQVNGTQIVGWDNFFGLNRWKHQLGSAALGFELLPRAGGLRLELAALTGSLLPLTGYSQGALTDAERSAGGSVRLTASDPSQRLRVDGAFTRSAFRNPNDPSLGALDPQGLPVNLVNVRRETRGAYYVDAGADLLRNAFAQSTRPLTVTLNYRGERVDPQYRSVGAILQSDRIQNQVEMITTAGPISLSASHQRSHDNLFGIASLMRTRTRQTGFNLAMPLSALWNQPPRLANWLPQVTYSLLDLHQLGTGNPAGFDSASQLPDQKNTNHNAMLEWTIGWWRMGYRFNRSAQDNRQPGRELADLINTVNTASIGWTLRGLTSSIEAGIEDVLTRELDQTNRTIRVATNNNWTIRRGLSLMVNLSLTRLSQFGTISRTRALEGDTQLTWDLSSTSGLRQHLRPQLFLRYANRYQSVFDGLFLVDALTRAQSIQMGMTLTVQ